MQGNRKNLLRGAVEETAGRDSGEGLPEASAIARCQSSRRLAPSAKQSARITLWRFEGFLEHENQPTMALGFPLE